MSSTDGGMIRKLRARLNKGDSWLTRDIGTLFRNDRLDDEALDEIETRLLTADAGVEATDWLMQRLRAEVGAGRVRNPAQLRATLKAALIELLAPVEKPLVIPDFIRPYILFVAGVNGVGKTTTIGKLALRFKREGRSVLLAAGDTFRAAAVEQLRTWSERAGVPILAQGEGADSASVIFDAVQSAKSRGIDIVIADTAGRLHTQSHLMEELRKIKRVVQKHDPYAPHEVLLVVDATTGGNALVQALQFHEAIGLTGIAITKLDGTAKGGILLAIARRQPFDAQAFAEALIGE
jgi:fused signal recognition particle receptor